ncbi:MAG: YHS domain-containing protein [Cytophagaceae bacterium]
MKNLSILFSAAVILFSCGGNNNQTAEQEMGGSNISYNSEIFASDIDPVCNMSIKNGAADTATVNGKLYGFCNTGCKEEFLKNTEKYLNKE